MEIQHNAIAFKNRNSKIIFQEAHNLHIWKPQSYITGYGKSISPYPVI
ncbi:hypothetical protein [Desulfamplus magnetovallimortis]|nr:hypothetical protein [Desulfamplus magnetovallimortis]